MIDDDVLMAGLADEYQVEEQIGHLLRRAHQRASSIFQARIGGSQITPTQFAALAKLYDLKEVSQNRLGRLTAMDPATIQGVTRRLIDRGLVEAKADISDKRRLILQLSEAGAALIAELIPSGIGVTRETLAPLSVEEREIICKLLKKLS